MRVVQHFKHGISRVSHRFITEVRWVHQRYDTHHIAAAVTVASGAIGAVFIAHGMDLFAHAIVIAGAVIVAEV